MGLRQEAHLTAPPVVAVALFAAACSSGDNDTVSENVLAGFDLALSDVVVTDEAHLSGYQDFWFGTWKRGRGNVIADFDSDGRIDVFIGNPGNESYLLRNVTEPGGPLNFVPWQVLSQFDRFYGGVATDFDNDGDPDLFVAAGANDGPAEDRFFRNDYMQGAPDDAPLVDISNELPIRPVDYEGVEFANRTMGANAFDADNNGLLDLFVSNISVAAENEFEGWNQLYMSLEPLQINDRSRVSGLDTRLSSRHSAVLDFDRDGDIDLFENNWIGPSVLWENQLVESGELSYTDVTAAMSSEGSMAGPLDRQAMCSLSADFNNDGWTDILVLNRGNDDVGAAEGHELWINVNGTTMVDLAEGSGLNDAFDLHFDSDIGAEVETDPEGHGWGVMGCQLGDVNLDGFPDVFMGNGHSSTPDFNRLFVQTQAVMQDVDGLGEVVVPRFENWSELINFRPTFSEHVLPIAPPYRSHGSAFGDFDGDGIPELSVHNGGPEKFFHEEPNRLFKFELPDPRFLRVHFEVESDDINRDAVGTYVVATVQRDADQKIWKIHRDSMAGTGFGAQNELDLVLGLADADTVLSLDVTWPDGEFETFDGPFDGTQVWVTVTRSSDGTGFLIDPR